MMQISDEMVRAAEQSIEFAKEARDLKHSLAENAYPAANGGADIDNGALPVIEVTMKSIVCRAISAALAAMWRPIEELDETDGRSVILGVERRGRIEEVHVGYFKWAVNEDEESCWWSEQADDEVCPTHFMPLPSPPKMEG